MHAKSPDLGRVKVSKAQSETGAFETPTLRNVAQSAPYMHDGSEATLTQGERADLVAFLEALSGDVTPVEIPTTFPR